MIQILNRNKLLILFILFFLFFRLVELGQVGETWDEIAKIRNGQIHLKAITHLDFSYSTWVTHKEHPPLGKILLALPTYLTTKANISILDDASIYQVSKQYNLARLVSLLFASATLLLTFLIAKRWFNKSVAWIALVGLAMFPHFVAHSFIATLESPQTFFVTLLFFLLVISEKELSQTKKQIVIGVAVALTLLTKFSSIFFLPLPFLFSLKYLSIKGVLKVFKENLIIYLLALLLFIVFWPWLWANPVSRIIQTLNHFNVTRTEYFMGQLVSPPFYYYFYYFVISVPVIYLLGFVIGLKNIFARKYILVLIWFLLPFIASFSGFKQNGVRYLHSSFPAFAILVAVGFDQIFTVIQEKKQQILIYLLLIFSLVITNVRVSPYYLDYYNILVGGSKGVYNNRLAQIGWWGEGTKQATIFLNSISKPNDTLCIKLTPAHVLPEISSNFKVYFDETEKITCNSMYLIVNTLDMWRNNYKVESNIYELIYKSEASNAPIVQVFKHK